MEVYLFSLHRSDVSQVLRNMEEENIVPDSFTFQYLIQMYSEMKDVGLCWSLFESMLSKGLEPTTVTLCNLVILYSPSKDLSSAKEIFECMGKYGVTWDINTFAFMLVEFVKKRTFVNPEFFFDLLSELGVESTTFLFDKLLELYSILNDKEAFEYVYNKMSNTLHLTVVSYVSFINFLISNRKEKTAKLLYDFIMSNGMKINYLLHDTVLRLCCVTLDDKLAHQTVQEMPENDLQPNIFSFNALMKIAHRRDELGHVFNLYDQAISQGLNPTYRTFLLLICSATFWRRVDLLEDIFNEMDFRCVNRSMTHFNNIFLMYTRLGDLRGVRMIYMRMMMSGFTLATHNYKILIKCLARFNQDALVQRFFGAFMNDPTIAQRADVETYIVMMQMFFHLKDYQRMKDTFEEMLRNKLQHNKITYWYALKHCSLQKDAQEICKMLKDSDAAVSSYNLGIAIRSLGRIDLRLALEVYEQMSPSVEPDTFLYSSLISIFKFHKLYNEVEICWNQMLADKVRPNKSTFMNVITSAVRRRSETSLQGVIQTLRSSGYEFNESILSLILREVDGFESLHWVVDEIVGWVSENPDDLPWFISRYLIDHYKRRGDEDTVALITSWPKDNSASS
eukprot:TRINITY_DN10963_c0_g1_i1.p1 TRINITY_DN10963_c0_g1~~TRINITY_DN10963_c0_g1_i1.p1  ORF type:complete len:621 (-),score=105.60 TRINITY_DN10963_c0_g1_i1:226-2088(-)